MAGVVPVIGQDDVSVVVPVYRNAETVESLHARIVAVLGVRLREVVYVDEIGRASCRERV